MGPLPARLSVRLNLHQNPENHALMWALLLIRYDTWGVPHVHYQQSGPVDTSSDEDGFDVACQTVWRAATQ